MTTPVWPAAPPVEYNGGFDAADRLYRKSPWTRDADGTARRGGGKVYRRRAAIADDGEEF